MNWFFISLAAPSLYALGNFIDQILLARSNDKSGVQSIILFSCFLGLLTLPIIYVIEPDSLMVDYRSALLLSINGMLTILSVWLYLKAIEKNEISVVVTVLQTTPIFAFVLGFLLLGETLSVIQIIGCIIILLAILAISLDRDEVGVFFLKKEAILLALASSLCFAITGIFFKFFALSNGYWQTQFWEYAGIALLGAVLFLFSVEYRNSFLSVFKRRDFTSVNLNFLGEIIMVTGDLVINFAVLLGPVAMIYVINSFQPIFVLLLGFIFTLFFPKIFKKEEFKKNLIVKLFSIILVMLGSSLLLF